MKSSLRSSLSKYKAKESYSPEEAILFGQGTAMNQEEVLSLKQDL